MNDATNNSTGLGDTFSSQSAPQTNPFTADLKGEFTSNFGTNTNAVSQIFKEGGFVSQNRTKYLIIGGVVIAVLAIVFFFLTGSDSSEEEFAAEDGAAEEGAAEEGEEGATDTAEKEEGKEEEEATATAEEKPAVEEAAAAPVAAAASVPSSGAMASGGPLTAAEPADGSTLNYDESQGAATFTWEGGGGHIVFSRSQSMSPPAMRVAVSGNSYAFHHPWPGTWYWKVENSSGATEVRSFKVTPPTRRNVQLSAPGAGGTVAGSGGTVSWQGDSKVAYYRVEFSTGSWGAPAHRFASSGNSVQLNGVAPGAYQMRVGAFSEVSGRWEYTTPVAVTVQ